MIINARNNIFSFVFILTYWLGVFFYELINNLFRFAYIDEIIAINLLVIFFILRILSMQRIKKITAIVFGIFIFYICYSCLLKVSFTKAILFDSLIVLKPFIAILIVLEIEPIVNSVTLSIIRISAIISALFLLVVFLGGEHWMLFFFGHPSRYASTAVIAAFLFVLSSNFEKRSIIIYLIIMSISIISGRTKAYGFWAISLLMKTFFYNLFKMKRFRINYKLVVPIVAMIVIVLLISWNKINYYFIIGTSREENLFARPALYIVSFRIALDYFPFGSGLGSFASHYSGVYYSSIYNMYGISSVHGLTEADPRFISDTFFPQLIGQFGAFGISLIFISIFQIIKKLYIWKNNSEESAKNFFLCISIITFLLIESIADSTFVQNRGMFVMLLLGYSMVSIKRKY